MATLSPPPSPPLVTAREGLLRFVRSRVPDDAAAEDIVQESILKALRAAPDLRDEERLESWLYQIVRNAIADHYRQEARTTLALSTQVLLEPEAAEPSDLAEICDCFRDLLPALSAGYAEVIQGVDLDGEPPAAAAARLGLSRGNLRVRLHRARAQLRERLEETCRTCATHGCLDCSCRKPAV
jgi:RNA polymerase sigma-70 factor, ECF subfamily